MMRPLAAAAGGVLAQVLAACAPEGPGACSDGKQPVIPTEPSR